MKDKRNRRGHLKQYILLYLARNLTLIEQSNSTNKHQAIGELITEITKRKTTKRAFLKGRNKEKRVKNWYDCFKEPLGKPAKVTSEKETVTTILYNSDLQFKTGHFTDSEYEQVRKQMKENMAQSPNAMNPEVLKRCEMNDIIIDFANSILINNKKPAQLGVI